MPDSAGGLEPGCGHEGGRTSRAGKILPDGSHCTVCKPTSVRPFVYTMRQVRPAAGESVLGCGFNSSVHRPPHLWTSDCNAHLAEGHRSSSVPLAWPARYWCDGWVGWFFQMPASMGLIHGPAAFWTHPLKAAYGPAAPSTNRTTRRFLRNALLHGYPSSRPSTVGLYPVASHLVRRASICPFRDAGPIQPVDKSGSTMPWMCPGASATTTLGCIGVPSYCALNARIPWGLDRHEDTVLFVSPPPPPAGRGFVKLGACILRTTVRAKPPIGRVFFPAQRSRAGVGAKAREKSQFYASTHRNTLRRGLVSKPKRSYRATVEPGRAAGSWRTSSRHVRHANGSGQASGWLGGG